MTYPPYIHQDPEEIIEKLKRKNRLLTAEVQRLTAAQSTAAKCQNCETQGKEFDKDMKYTGGLVDEAEQLITMLNQSRHYKKITSDTNSKKRKLDQTIYEKLELFQSQKIL